MQNRGAISSPPVLVGRLEPAIGSPGNSWSERRDPGFAPHALAGVCCAGRPGAPFRLLIPAVRTWQAMPAPKRIKVIALTTLLVGVALILATLLF